MENPLNQDSDQKTLRQDLPTLVRRNSYYVLIERTVAPAVNFLVTVLIVRKLAVDEFGIYNILLAMMGYIALLSSLGVPSVFQRYIPEFYMRNQIGQLKKLVQKGLILRLLLCTLILLVVFLFSEKVGDLFKFEQAFRYLALFAAAIIFFLQTELLSTAFTSIFHHKLFVLAQISYVMFRAVLLVFLFNLGKGLEGLLIAESASFGFLLFLQLLFYRKFFSHHVQGSDDKLPLRRLFKFGGMSYFNEIGAEILSVSTDYFIISAFLGPVAVGIYAFANKVMMLASRIMPHVVFMDVIRPAFFSRYSQDENPTQLNQMFNFVSKLIAFFMIPLVIGIFSLGDKMITFVFGARYLDSLTVLWVVACFYALNFFMFPTGLVLQSIEKVKFLFYSKIFAVYNIVADILIVKQYGILGIAVITGSAVLFKNIFCFFFAKKYTQISFDFKSMGKIVLNASLMGVFLYGFRTRVTNLSHLILIILCGAVLYLSLSYFNKIFSQEERNYLNNILPRPVFQF